MPRTLAIDLGTASILVWAKGEGIVLDEPSVLAVDVDADRVLAMGAQAYDAVGRSNRSVVVNRPLRGGAVTDPSTTARLLELVLARVEARRRPRSKVVICVPTAATDVERRAVEDAARSAGAAAAYLMEEPLAAAIGAGLPVEDAVGSMVVDLGGGTCEVAVVSLGGVVVSRGIRVGGLDLDEAIREHVRIAHGVAIGDRTAEDLKLEVGSAAPLDAPAAAEVYGREVSSGRRTSVVVTDDEVRAALEPAVNRIVRAVVGALSDAPPELVHDVIEHGMHLVGGGAKLRGLDTRLARETEVRVTVVDDPRRAVVKGAGRAIESTEDLRGLFGRD